MIQFCSKRKVNVRPKLIQDRPNIWTSLFYIEHAAQIAKDAANRWTENVWEMQSYCVNKFGIDRTAFDQQFGIPDDFDTI